MDNPIVEYLQTWQAKHASDKRVYLMPLVWGGDVYGIEVRFPPTRYTCDDETFDMLAATLSRRSLGVLQTVSASRAFRLGVLSLTVGFCNHGYSPRKVIAALECLLTEIMPSLQRWR